MRCSACRRRLDLPPFVGWDPLANFSPGTQKESEAMLGGFLQRGPLSGPHVVRVFVRMYLKMTPSQPVSGLSCWTAFNILS